MKNFTKIVSFCMLLLLSVNHLFADEIRPEAGVLNSLSDAINSASAGDVIILERGGFYYHQLTTEIAVSLTIKADDANPELPKPIVSLLVREDGSTPLSNFDVKADLTCENIHFRADVSGRAEHDDVRRCMEWTTTPNMRAVFKGCVWEDYDARTLVLEAPDMRFYAYDCLWLNDHKTPGPSEGRPIDLRQFGPDTLIVQNSSFINTGNRWIRHLPSSGQIDAINYAVIDHCTFVNCSGYHPAFDFGTIEKLQFTNNVVQNAAIMGSDFTVQSSQVGGQGIIALPEDYYSSDKTKRPYRLSEVFYDREDGIVILACHGVDSIGTEITMHNNNIYSIPEIAAKLATNDTIFPAAIWATQFQNSIVGDVSAAYSEEAIEFVAGSDLVGDGFNWIDSILDPYFGYWDKNQFYIMPWPDVADIDLSYGTTAAAYTGAERGFPLGDLNWYPDLKALWESGGSVSVSEPQIKPEIKVFPNPATDYLTLYIDTEKPVAFKLYNIQGQMMYSVDVTNNLTIDLNQAGIGDGFYLYSIESENQSIAGKIMVIK